jgi:hypothetical protein
MGTEYGGLYSIISPPPLPLGQVGASCLGPNHDLAGRSVERKAGITCRPIQSRDTTTNSYTPPTLHYTTLHYTTLHYTTLHYLELAHDVSRRPSTATSLMLELFCQCWLPMTFFIHQDATPAHVRSGIDFSPIFLCLPLSQWSCVCYWVYMIETLVFYYFFVNVYRIDGMT